MMKNIENLVENHLKLHDIYVKNPSWIVKSSNLGGRGLFANRDIEAGEVIFEDYPIIIGPRAVSTCPVVCVTCYSNDNLFVCSNMCGLPVCSEKCQNSNLHREECLFVTRSKCFSSISKNLVKCLTPIRSLFLNDGQIELLTCLKAHAGPLHGFEVDTLKNKVGLIFDENEEAMMRLCCTVLDANSFEVIVGNEENQSSLRGLYPLSSLLNHDCVPNTMHIFNEHRHMVVKATKFIALGEELCHSYTRLMWGTSVRRPHLVRTKHFLCKCKLCKDPTEFGTNMSAMKCPCNGYILPYFEDRPKPIWKCNNCENEIPDEKVGFLISVFGSSLNSFEILSPEEVIRLIKNKLMMHLPPTSQVILELKYKLIWFIGYKQNYTWKDISMELLKEKELICRELLQVLDALHAGQCKMRGLLLYELFCCLRETSKRLELDVANNVLEDSFKYATKEMKNMFHEARQILMHDVHAPTELKDYNLQEKQIGGN